MFGQELREARTRRGLGLRSCAARLNYSPGQLSKVETGKRRPTQQLARAVDALLSTGDYFERLWSAANHGVPSVASGSTDDPLIAHELPNGKVVFVPASRRQFIQGVGAAAAASLLSTIPAAPAAAAEVKPLAHFQAAHRLLIDTDNMLGAANALPGVHEQLRSLHSIRQTAQGQDGQDLVNMQARFAELAGWLCQDLGDFEQARYWLDRALEWSYPAGDPELTAYVLARKSQLAGDMGDALGAVDLAHAAARQAPNERIVAVAQTYAAHGHALGGSPDATEASYDGARSTAERFDGQSPWGVWLDDSYIDVHRAHSLSTLGRHDAAVETFRAAIAALPAGFHRDRGVYLAREALAHAGAHDTAAATQAGLQALAIARDTRSGRTATELRQLDTALADQGGQHAAAFRDAMRDATVIT
ncbi:putative C1 regulatory protein [Pseudonocardia sp. Ae356_Ps1]|nr:MULTISPECIES: helix-turn-helix transcriptional regulator [unclassified Pseudonocardia]OLL74341.1 putative C1 regulatory protein [Pseudonocardia sp. Ae150A_Ps1]OLL94421.1 putative C1 regulatory protein [Pseudonocardia sp. Ae356_Ps1]